jgi:hypothetical protein
MYVKNMVHRETKDAFLELMSERKKIEKNKIIQQL